MNTFPNSTISLAKEIANLTFKNEKGEPIELSDGQAEIFWAIYAKQYPRVEIIAPTQYGKSNTVSMALILRTQQFRENFTIVTGQQKKSDVIMEKVIDHLFDNQMLLANLEVNKNEPLDRLRRERSKKRVVWKDGGGITAITADARNRRNVVNSLSGLGSGNIVEDESSLIPDDLQDMVLRMLGGYGGGFLVKIGNPYYRNHFYRTSLSKKYKQIFIDYTQALKEGRYSETYIEEMREQMNPTLFSVLYECQFPEADRIDEGGYSSILLEYEFIGAIVEGMKHSGEMRLGYDVGEGGDGNRAVLRSDTFAELVHESYVPDLMAQVGIIIDLKRKYGLKWENIFIDDTGIGAGVTDRLVEMGYSVNGIKWAGKPRDEMYANIKAENYDALASWIRAGGKLKQCKEWDELRSIKTKVNSSGKILVKSKEEMRKEGLSSPNTADALAFTFNETDFPNVY